ncbi:UDP-2,4-diacetamido-2,4,6-trideoxy-beta-L-altropyranose hydrolase [Marinobacter flavimaris]|uniref:UDP-2,4-diacetamido-2,4, 6-trideoxy-beta-L-altropyranose hydrolase n=2 Tax=Marinobacter flavimaris TaxID=262076 RepID=A0A3D8H7V4_9GAMM|nr:UDP-2,4-diacetamido-2,4,6-trideoxy-beta-L-altropyranose hydrolase [Marinobacter flavimaris]RDU42396.1 UDP-2,4-diacetamido-2,4,6-trideoxy-beta-L-altropyranose hydrolase [Marinobacter flavimaris]
MNVVFRADASLRIGSGHVMRCLTLAEELRRQGHRCEFVCRDHAGHLGEFIASKDFTCHLLANTDEPVAKPAEANSKAYSDWLGVDWETDAEQTLAAIGALQVDWLVADHYALDSRWEKRLATVARRVMVIDDLADRVHECDLLLDQNLGTEASDYSHKVPTRCSKLIGPRFALLRPEFPVLRDSALKRRAKPSIKRILISLGGVDLDNVTAEVMRAFTHSSLPLDTELDIVLGAAAPYLEEVRALARELPFRATVSVSVSDMAERMCRADISVGAAGSTSWERCCLGLPAIMVVLAENQRAIGNALATSGSAILLDKDAIADQLGGILDELVGSDERLQSLADNARKICDGRGTSRLVSEMIRISKS